MAPHVALSSPTFVVANQVNGAPTTVPTLLSVMNAAAATGSPLSINAATSQGLPPSPATAFARAWPGVHANVFRSAVCGACRGSLPQVDDAQSHTVMSHSSYNQAYGDKLYHSQFDNAPSAVRANVGCVCKHSTILT